MTRQALEVLADRHAGNTRQRGIGKTTFFMPVVEGVLRQLEVALAGGLFGNFKPAGTQARTHIVAEDEAILANEADEVHCGIAAQPATLLLQPGHQADLVAGRPLGKHLG